MWAFCGLNEIKSEEARNMTDIYLLITSLMCTHTDTFFMLCQPYHFLLQFIQLLRSPKNFQGL